MNQDSEQPDEAKSIQNTAFVVGVILLPGLFGGIFGWMHGLLPLVVFYLLRRHGKRQGTRFILSGSLIAGLAGAVFQMVEPILFSITLLPAGFILADSVEKGDSLHLTGFKGTIVLGGSWLLLSTILSMGLEHHPYALLLTTLNQGMDDALAYYKQNGSIPEDTILLLQQTFAEMKLWLPRVMPGILACITLLIIWFTMVAGNQLLYRKTGTGPWPEYRFWSLPDKLIWALIVSAILVLLPTQEIRTVGINLLMVTGLLYCFQGIAIMLFYFYKWSVPVFLRVVIYIMLAFQSFGAIILAILGVVDVWFDLRRLQGPDHEIES